MPDRPSPPRVDDVRQGPSVTTTRHGEPCAGCHAPVATRHDAPGGAVWLCPGCAATADLGCP